MAFTIATKHGEKTFADKELVNISSSANADFSIDLGFQFMLTVQCDPKTNRCVLLNQFRNQRFLFKGKSIPAQLEIDKVCKIMVDGSDEFITIKVLGETSSRNISEENMSEADMKAIYGNDVNAVAKIMVEKRKAEIENARVGIIKDVGARISDLKRKISQNSKGGIFWHIVLFLASFVCAFGVSNYLTGLPLKDAGAVIQMPTNMKLIFIYALIIYGIGLVLKQGVYNYLQNRLGNDSTTSKLAEGVMVISSLIFYSAVYLINVLYYISPKTFPVFAVLFSLFFVGTAITLAIACGYYKNSSVEMKNELNSIEYREDFEHVIKEYQQWIERYTNTLSPAKIRNIKDKQFMLQIQTFGEIVLGLITAPFLAFAVSNTLAMCFPEAAGWIRLSGNLRLSPVFLTLATFMIMFGFFAFANAFLNGKKIAGSDVLKQDGFSNYLQHGVEIYGIEGINRLNKDMRRNFLIGCGIILIEYTMNVSYFMGEMGGDLSGLATQFELFACDEVIAKIDRLG